MKAFAKLLDSVLPQIKIAPKYFWALFLGYYGMWAIAVLIWLIDWVSNGGTRAELMELIKLL